MAIIETLEDRQKAISLTAYAYWLKGECMQYDSVMLTDLRQEHGGNKRQNCYVAPEEATPQRTVYTVCSSFAYEVYKEALGYELMGAFMGNYTSNYFNHAPEAITVFKYDRRTSDMPMEEALEKLKALMEPGDAVVGVKEKSGHIMIYCGDVDGDGVPKLIHSSSNSAYGGGKFNMETGIDKVEVGGDIRKDDAFGFLFEDRGKGKCYYLGADSRVGFILLRPLMEEAARLPLTPSARGRLRYPMLRIDRTADCGYYGSAPSGGNLTYRITVSNHSRTDYTDIPVVETVPDGTELCCAEGAAVCGRNLMWSLKLNAGEVKTLAYTVAVKAQRGSVIVSGNGSVAGIPSNTLCSKVCGTAPDAVRLADAAVWQAAVENENAAGMDFAASVYRHALGIDLRLPAADELFADLFEQDMTAPVTTYRPAERKKRWEALAVQDYVGGKKIVVFNSNLRVLDFRPEDLTAGDIIIRSGELSKSVVDTAWVYTGKMLVGLVDGKLTEIPQTEMVKLMTGDFFMALRPSQMFDL